ncbi:uncharacterized protein EKO05_0006046 [Ascochyta rabiei]|uniref:GDP-mannose transporter n=1 Tax=Didymella rabiei TaxID=5454 RepID=A0A163ID84_DIDRA|nr:uncharacterized protein EKO05_0006046 [Ascochyta rabiei]KZM25712.1 hypothetical protein ST47_g3116 [Ascochyta rabiei]UPX15603.1 hypothetical protein EKO05_0006046 [Ascochyta rabiei]
MNHSRPFARSPFKPFRPAFDYLSQISRSAIQLPTAGTSKPILAPFTAHRRKTTADSLDGTDDDIEGHADSNMDGSRRPRELGRERDLDGLGPTALLIDIGSRATSPYPRSRSAAPSEDEDDYYELSNSNSISNGISNSISIGTRPLVGGGRGAGYERPSWKMIFGPGGLGNFLFGTWAGWQIWIGLLVFWVGGCGFGLLLMNRFIMLTGVYKFPFPLTGTYLQLILTHLLLVAFSSLTRGLASPLRRLGFGAAVAPAIPIAPIGGAFRSVNIRTGVARFLRWLTNGSGGIAGGGLFEFDFCVAKHVLPLAAVFVAKVLLSNFSFAYAPLRVYQLARVGVTPLSLVFSCLLQRDSLSGSTLSAALIATLNLLFATLGSNVRVTWESIVAGVFSSFFAALYPILLLRTYRTLLARLLPLGDLLSGYPTGRGEGEDCGNREETRAYYRTLHYTSLLSIALLTPIVLLSGELPNIYHNIPFLDVPFFWLMIWCGAIGSWAVFSSTLLLAKATSPLSATFVNVPRSAVQLMLLSMFKMPAYSWVGVALCWAASAWYAASRRAESRGTRVRLEGR